MNLKTSLPRDLQEGGYLGPHARAINQLKRAIIKLEPVATPENKYRIGPNGTARTGSGSSISDNNNQLPRWL